MDKIEGWKLVPIGPTEEMVAAAWNESLRLRNLNPTERLTHSIAAAIAAAPTPPEQEAEPVAEVVWFADGPWGEILPGHRNISSKTKLYTRTTNDKLRKAAEEGLRCADTAVELLIAVWQGEKDADWTESEIHDLITARENLRAALEKP